VELYEEHWENTQITQLKFDKVVAEPMLTYASGNWTKNCSDKRKIEVAKRRFLRPVARYTLLNHKQNTDFLLLFFLVG
jgi:hypothetical protein